MCRRPHHELLHEAEGPDALNIAFIKDSSKAILPIISSFVKGKQDEFSEVNVFHDSGAQVSMIRSACADQLGLGSKPTSL